jgi:hypothetical protein
LLRHGRNLDVTAEMPKLIRTYNEATGVANTDTSGYHETITLVSIRAARSVLDKHGESNSFLTLAIGHSQYGRTGRGRVRQRPTSATSSECQQIRFNSL